MNSIEELQHRQAQINALSLSHGSHKDFEHGACVMEAISYIAGEPWGDHPECSCPVITGFCVSWNDNLPNNEARDRLLKPLIPLIVGTCSTREVEKRRSYLALDWLIRVSTSKWLDMVPALHQHANALRKLDAIADMASAAAAGKRVVVAEVAAWAAASAATGVRAGAWDASGGAACAAARAATVAKAADMARADASRAAAWSASRAAGCDAIKLTTEWLQASAQQLLRDMIAVTSVAEAA